MEKLIITGVKKLGGEISVHGSKKRRAADYGIRIADKRRNGAT